MKKFTILMSLFCLTIMAGSAFAEQSFEYDDFENHTVSRSGGGCTHFVNDFGFTNYRKKLCMELVFFFPGKWTKETLIEGVAHTPGGLRKKHPNMSIYTKLLVHNTDWLFVEKVVMKINDGKKYTIASNTFDQREVITGDHIVEISWAEVDQDSDVYLNFWRPILNGKVAKNSIITARIYGANGHVTYKDKVK